MNLDRKIVRGIDQLHQQRGRTKRSLSPEEGNVGAEHLVQRRPVDDPAWEIGLHRELPGFSHRPANF
jgi:hypothetical protein